MTHQEKASGRQERYMVHVVNYSPLRSTPEHPDFYEDPIPLSDVVVRLHLPLKPRRVKGAVSRTDYRPRVTRGVVEVTVPRIPVHEIVVFEA